MNQVLPLLLLALCLIGLSPQANAQINGDLPPNAIAGKCYAKCLIQNQYETVTEQIVLKEASTKLEVIPAVYETIEEQLLVKEAHKIAEIKPARFTTKTEQLLIKEPAKRLEYIPPVFETVSEQVLIMPALNTWVEKRGTRSCLSANPKDCEMWCLVETPAKYKTVSKQVLKKPAETREISIPAEYRTVSRQVLESPMQIVEREVPAKYRTVRKNVLKSPATTQEVEVPLQYGMITTHKLVRMGGFTDWVEVICPQ